MFNSFGSPLKYYEKKIMKIISRKNGSCRWGLRNGFLELRWASKTFLLLLFLQYFRHFQILMFLQKRTWTSYIQIIAKKKERKKPCVKPSGTKIGDSSLVSWMFCSIGTKIAVPYYVATQIMTFNSSSWFWLL